MIPRGFIQEWRAVAPWPEFRQVEQDLVISRALCDLFSSERLKGRIAFRGATVVAEIVRKGLEAEYFCSPSPKGVLRVAFPERMREALFPKLYFPAVNNEA